jgi:hypothetical protein
MPFCALRRNLQLGENLKRNKVPQPTVRQSVHDRCFYTVIYIERFLVFDPGRRRCQTPRSCTISFSSRRRDLIE